MSFTIVPIEVKDQIFAHLPLSTRMSLRQCSRIDRHVVAISKTVVEEMIIQRDCVLVKSSDESLTIKPSYQEESNEEWKLILSEKLKNFLKIVGNRLNVKKLVLQDANESTSNFIRQLNWNRIGCIDLVTPSSEDLARFFDVIGNRMYEARSLKLTDEHIFNDDDMEKFKNLRRFESGHRGELTHRSLKTFIRNWIEKDELEYHYFYLQTDCGFCCSNGVHGLDLDAFFEGLVLQKHWEWDGWGVIYITKKNSEVGRLSVVDYVYDKVSVCFVANNNLKFDTDVELFEKEKQEFFEYSSL